ncbi:MAG: DNA polymerase III subunit delta [Erysipelotrichaceae bacterium]
MDRSLLQQQQRVAYQVLHNAFSKDALSHAYLFVGEKGTYKRKMAYYMSQALVCQQDSEACEQCEDCLRIQHGNYADLIFIDGAKETIKKEHILRIQQQFSKTALEKRGKKIFILNMVEHATPDAMNTLLKFLEEPSNDVTAILITEQLDRLLPTIVSRTQVVKFKKAAAEQLYAQALVHMDYELDAFLLSHLVNGLEEMIRLVEEDTYQRARSLFEQTAGILHSNAKQALYLLQSEGFSKKKQDDREVFVLYLNMITLFVKYKAEVKQSNVPAFDQILGQSKLTKEQAIKVLFIVLQCNDTINKSINLNLLIDSFIYQIKEVLA